MMWARLKCFFAGCVLPEPSCRGERASCSRCGRRHFADVREGPLEWIPFGLIPKGGVGYCVPPEPGSKPPRMVTGVRRVGYNPPPPGPVPPRQPPPAPPPPPARRVVIELRIGKEIR